jgi:hypothetical protein
MFATSAKMRTPVVAASVAGIWLAAVLAGFAAVIDFEMTPGVSGGVPAQRPEGFAPGPSTRRPTLIVFAHPRCPCTSATIAELKQILAAHAGELDVQVFFRTPEELSEEWTNTPLWKEAAALPGATVTADPGGALARQFKARTSGHVLLYSAAGRLLFSGGITPSRGQTGDNPGRRAIDALLRGRSEATSESDVFGCPIFNSSDACQNGESCPNP